MIVDVDAWDGYRANRDRVLDHIQDNKISNTIILSGDSHANWVSDLACERRNLFHILRTRILNLEVILDPNDTVQCVVSVFHSTRAER